MDLTDCSEDAVFVQSGSRANVVNNAHHNRCRRLDVLDSLASSLSCTFIVAASLLVTSVKSGILVESNANSPKSLLCMFVCLLPVFRLSMHRG